MKALIFRNKVVDVSRETFTVASELTWVDCPNDCQAGWVLIDGQLQPEPEKEKTQQELLAMYTEKLQEHIDLKAIEKNYKNGYACASYKDSTVQQWAQEATAFIAWRDACWKYAYSVLAKVEAGEEAPSLEDFLNKVPVINWIG